MSKDKQKVQALDGADGYDGILVYDMDDELIDRVPYGDDPTTAYYIAMAEVRAIYDVVVDDINFGQEGHE